jgi:hypothetical protein
MLCSTATPSAIAANGGATINKSTKYTSAIAPSSTALSAEEVSTSRICTPLAKRSTKSPAERC